MAMGRPRKPEHLKEIEGNPGKRDLNRHVPSCSGAVSRPEYLTGYAVEVWEQVVSSMPPALYAGCDSQVLAAFCSAAKLHRHAAIEMERAEEPQEIRQWATTQSKAATTIVATGAKLGLDPSSRSAMVMPSGKKEQSKFAGLLPIAGGRSG